MLFKQDIVSHFTGLSCLQSYDPAKLLSVLMMGYFIVSSVVVQPRRDFGL